MGRVCFYSDDSFSGIAAKRFSFVVAGIALDAVKSEVEVLLLGTEVGSGKGERDWHSTKDLTIKREYIEELLRTHHLVGVILRRVGFA